MSPHTALQLLLVFFGVFSCRFSFVTSGFRSAKKTALEHGGSALGSRYKKVSFGSRARLAMELLQVSFIGRALCETWTRIAVDANPVRWRVALVVVGAPSFQRSIGSKVCLTVSVQAHVRRDVYRGVLSTFNQQDGSTAVWLQVIRTPTLVSTRWSSLAVELYRSGN